MCVPRDSQPNNKICLSLHRLKVSQYRLILPLPTGSVSLLLRIGLLFALAFALRCGHPRDSALELHVSEVKFYSRVYSALRDPCRAISVLEVLVLGTRMNFQRC